MDTNTEIRRAVDTGKVSFGYKTTLKTLAKGEGQLVILSSNIPANEKENLKHIAEVANKKCLEVPENGLVLGSICGKPFVVSVMLILDAGKSKVLELK